MFTSFTSCAWPSAGFANVDAEPAGGGRTAVRRPVCRRRCAPRIGAHGLEQPVGFVDGDLFPGDSMFEDCAGCRQSAWSFPVIRLAKLTEDVVDAQRPALQL